LWQLVAPLPAVATTHRVLLPPILMQPSNLFYLFNLSSLTMLLKSTKKNKGRKQNFTSTLRIHNLLTRKLDHHLHFESH
jgi:hypothetical protein